MIIAEGLTCQARYKAYKITLKVIRILKFLVLRKDFRCTHLKEMKENVPKNYKFLSVLEIIVYVCLKFRDNTNHHAQLQGMQDRDAVEIIN